MGRRLAAALAIVALFGCGVAAWFLVIDDSGEESSSSPRGANRSPTERIRKPKDEPEPVRFTVSVSGDLLMHGPLLARALANGAGSAYDFAPFFEAIGRYVRGADLALCHVETPMGPGAPASYPIFNTPTGLAASIHRSGWDACSTASNHSLDQGLEGIRGTAAALDDRDVAHAGSFPSRELSRRPTILKVRGAKLGYISYTDATNGIPSPTAWAVNEYAAADPKAGADAILADARRAHREGADAVIVNLHWGDENSSYPNESQLAVAKRLTASPLITAVVGQGPHVVQPIWRLNDKFVVFSEGNLVSNQGPASGLPAATQDGLIALLRFEAKRGRVRVERVDYVPIWVRPGDYVVLPAEPSADPNYAGALRDSRVRTISVAGDGEGIEPLRGG
jgi:poly-gamma-glutamate capsule biosynthesis protein CapA/YwtB (metallophosphatase superfamily)